MHTDKTAEGTSHGIEAHSISNDDESVLSDTSTCVGGEGEVTSTSNIGKLAGKSGWFQRTLAGLPWYLTHVYMCTLDSVFTTLDPHVARHAFYNFQKLETEYASTCQPGTHARVLQDIEEWLRNAQQVVYWLHGATGTGKSSIARTVAQRYQDSRLAATFLSGKKTASDDYQKLIPTLAYQIANKIPSSQHQMEEALHEDRTLPVQTTEVQFRKLIIEPLKNTEASNGSLIVIDGLDGPAASETVTKLIKLLGEISASGAVPLRFLLTSRAEPHIEEAFRKHMTASNFVSNALEDSREKVRKYLQHHLLDVRKQYDSDMTDEPSDWPSIGDLDVLVGNSDGLLLYATTLVRYVEDGRESPQVKLRKALRLQQGVDPLYHQVVSEARHGKDFHRIIAALVFLRYPLPMIELARFFRMDVSYIRTTLTPCCSVLMIPEDDLGSIRPYHASLRDFLTDEGRSRDCFCDPARSHASITIQCLQAVTESLGSGLAFPEYAGVAWYAHCASLLSGAKNGSEAFRSLYREVEVEMKMVNPEWLKHWMMETLPWAGIGYIKVGIPSSKVRKPNTLDKFALSTCNA